MWLTKVDGPWDSDAGPTVGHARGEVIHVSSLVKTRQPTFVVITLREGEREGERE